ELSVCEDTCCPEGNVCSFKKCVAPGKECGDSADCDSGEYCELLLGNDATDGGAAGGSCVSAQGAKKGQCVPRPPLCPDGTMTPDDLSCLAACEYHPATANFAPELKYSWGGVTSPPDYYSDVVMTPIVINLDDDNCDGKIDGSDIPEILF